MPAGPFRGCSAGRGGQPRFALFHPPENHRQRTLLQLRTRHHSGFAGIHLAGDLGRAQPLRRHAVPDLPQERTRRKFRVHRLALRRRPGQYLDRHRQRRGALRRRDRPFQGPRHAQRPGHGDPQQGDHHQKGPAGHDLDGGQQPRALLLRPRKRHIEKLLRGSGEADASGEYHLILLRREQRVLALALLLEPLPRRQDADRGDSRGVRRPRAALPQRQHHRDHRKPLQHALCGQRRQGRLRNRAPEQQNPDADPQRREPLCPRIALFGTRRRAVGGHYQGHLRLPPRQRRDPPPDSRPAGQVLTLGQPHAFGAGRRFRRHLDRHQRRRGELLGGFSPEFRQILHRRGRTARQLSRAGIRRRRRGTALDHHREIGADDLLAQDQRTTEIPEQTASRNPFRHRLRRREVVAGLIPRTLPTGPEDRGGEGLQPPGRVVEPARQQDIQHLQDHGG